MKLLVCISCTPDTTAKIEFTDENTRFKEEDMQFIMNPYDEWYALVKALEIKEEHGGSVTVCHVGLSEHDNIIRKALAIGADNAIRINKAPHDALDVATQIASITQGQGYDLILTGKETINYNGSEVGSMLAEMLTMPFISFANHLQCSSDKATVSREIEGGDEVISLAFPFILSASKGLAEQRIPNMRGIMMAKRKPLEVVEPQETPKWSEITAYAKPQTRTDCDMIDPAEMDALVKKLHEEAKVI